jgi:hypothetical protein
VQKRPIILRFVAIVLILVFSQKSGTGLFIHSLLHTGNMAGESPLKKSEKDKHLGYACTCIDDFLMPFVEAGETGSVQFLVKFVIPGTFFKEHIPFRTSILSFPRGPPAFIM